MNDLFQLENQYSDEQRLIRDSVKKYVDEEALPLFTDAFENGEFPRKLIDGVAQLGLLGMTLPQNYGGSDSDYMTYGLVCQELERGDSGLRSFVSVQSSLCMYPIYTYGSEEQRNRFLKPMSTAKLIGCFGLTEPDAGSDPSSMKTTARKVDGGWILNGSKMWITNAPIADLAVVWAKTEDGIRGFIVEKEFPGFVRNTIHHKMSLRASVTGELVFTDCFIPDANFMPGSICGMKAPLSCLSQARYGICWGVMGAAMACFDAALSYTGDRKQFNRPVASFQLIQSDLADMYTEIVKAQCLNLQLGHLKNANQATPDMISVAKRNACREALNIARKSRNLLGANGISLEYPVIRHMMNLESVFTYEGTDNIHTLIIGKYLTGIDAFS